MLVDQTLEDVYLVKLMVFMKVLNGSGDDCTGGSDYGCVDGH